MDKLRKLQLVEKDCLDFFVKICEENNLEYILDFGTLLGAADIRDSSHGMMMLILECLEKIMKDF